jgi:hypothetical protein
MKIFVALANPEVQADFAGYLDAFRKLAHEDQIGKHALVDSPKVADCILFIDAHLSLSVDYYRIIDNHPLTKSFPEKVMLYDEYDRPPSFGRGLYVSIPRFLFNKSKHAVVCYWINGFDSQPLDRALNPRTKFCFFAGAVSYNPTRARVVKQLSGSVVHVKDTSAVSPWKTGADAPTPEALHKSRLEYSEMMTEHQYCIAPLGKGTSSIRMFEAFAHGTVPIVMANEYVAPQIPSWIECVVTVDQRRPLDVIALQMQLQQEFASRQNLALHIQDRYFALNSRWNFFGDQLERVLCSDPVWRSRSKSDELTTKLYWIQHRLIKRIESRIV